MWDAKRKYVARVLSVDLTYCGEVSVRRALEPQSIRNTGIFAIGFQIIVAFSSIEKTRELLDAAMDVNIRTSMELHFFI